MLVTLEIESARLCFPACFALIVIVDRVSEDATVTANFGGAAPQEPLGCSDRGVADGYHGANSSSGGSEQDAILLSEDAEIFVCPQQDAVAIDDADFTDPLVRRGNVAQAIARQDASLGEGHERRFLRPTLTPKFRPGKIFLPLRHRSSENVRFRLRVFLVPMGGGSLSLGASYASPRRRPLLVRDGVPRIGRDVRGISAARLSPVERRNRIKPPDSWREPGGRKKPAVEVGGEEGKQSAADSGEAGEQDSPSSVKSRTTPSGSDFALSPKGKNLKLEKEEGDEQDKRGRRSSSSKQVEVVEDPVRRAKREAYEAERRREKERRQKLRREKREREKLAQNSKPVFRNSAANSSAVGSPPDESSSSSEASWEDDSGPGSPVNLGTFNPGAPMILDGNLDYVIRIYIICMGMELVVAST